MNMLQMCGPTGIGFLYGKSELLSAMPPFLGMPVLLYDHLLLIVSVSNYKWRPFSKLLM